MYYPHEFLVIFLEEVVTVDLRVVLVGCLVVLSGLFQQAEHAGIPKGLDDLDYVRQVIKVVSHIGRKLVVNPFFSFEFAQTTDVELHHFLSQTPTHTISLALQRTHR